MRNALEIKTKTHVTGMLPAYLDDALTLAERTRVERHLQRCAACRQSHEALQAAQQTLKTLPILPAPDRIWHKIEANIQTPEHPNTGRPLVDRTPEHQRFHARTLVAACASLLLLACIGAWFRHFRIRKTADEGGISALAASWKVNRLDGSPVVGQTAFTGAARLRVGESLTTDARSRARVQVADIGQVDIAPNSKIRLVQTRADRHRLALDRGELSARVTAPPRLFLVDTPSAVAVDLGCAYTLNVDDAGNSRLRVTKGCVALEQNGADTEVPAGAVCLTRKGIGTGTPFFTNAPVALQQAVQRFDFENGGEVALRVILDKARIEDTLTLYSLLARVTPPQRERVIDGLLAYVAFPDGVTRAGIRKLDTAMLAQWKEQMVFFWY